MASRIKPRVTITIDAKMLAEVDDYVREHDGSDRSKVVDDALRCWYAGVLRDALARQHSALRSPEEQEERAAWKRIRAAQMAHAEGIHSAGRGA